MGQVQALGKAIALLTHASTIVGVGANNDALPCFASKMGYFMVIGLFLLFGMHLIYYRLVGSQ